MARILVGFNKGENMARNRKKVNKSFEERIYIDKSTSSISYLFNFINQIKNVHFEKEDIDYGLMNIYGIGGKGKSALIEEFIIQLEKNGYDYINFDADKFANRVISMEDTLLDFRNQLVSKYGFEFPLFDLRIVIQKSPSPVELSEKLTSNDSLNASNSIKNIKRFLLPVVDFFEDRSITLGLFNLGNDLLEAYDEYKSEMNGDTETTILNSYIRYKQKNPKDFLYLLLDDFVTDYNKNIERLRKKNSDYIMTIILDTFEDFNMVEDWLFYGDEKNNDYGFCHNLSFTCWTVGGRKDLNLNEGNGWDSSNYLSVNAENFTEVESNSYIDKKIDNNKDFFLDNDEDLDFIKRNFFKKTNGDPLASNLLANQALRNNSSDAISIIEDLDYSSDLYEEIVYRYLKYIESNKRESNLIKLMISIGMFKKEDIQELVSTYNLEINMLDFDEIIERLIDFKFISNVYQDKNNDDYTDEIYEIDKLIKNYLINIKYPRKHKDYDKPIINTDYKNAALNYLSRKLVNYGHKEEFYIKQIIQLIDSLGIENKSEALRLKREKYFNPYLEFLKNEKDYDEVLRLLILIINSENKCQIDDQYYSELLIEILDTASQHAPYLYSMEIEKLINSQDSPCNNQNFIYKASIYLNRRNQYDKSYQLLNSNFKIGDLSIENHINLMWLLYRLQKLEELDNVIKSAELKLRDINDSMYYMTVVHIYKCLIYIHQGQYDLALDLYNNVQSFIYYNDIKLDNYLLYNLEAYGAIILNKTGYFQQAMEINLRLVKRLESWEKNFENKSLIANTLNNLGMNYNNLGMRKESERAFTKAYNIRKSILPKDSDDLLQSENNYSIILMNNGKYLEALDILSNTLKKNIKIFGENHIKVARNLYNIGQCYQYLEDYYNAKEFYFKSYVIKKEFYYNSDDKDTIRTYLRYLVSLAHDLNENNEEYLAENLKKFMIFILTNENLRCIFNNVELKDTVELLFKFRLRKFETLYNQIDTKLSRNSFRYLYAEMVKNGIDRIVDSRVDNQSTEFKDKISNFIYQQIQIDDINELADSHFDSLSLGSDRFINVFENMIMEAKDNGIRFGLLSINRPFEIQEDTYNDLLELYLQNSNSIVGTNETYNESLYILNHYFNIE